MDLKLWVLDCRRFAVNESLICVSDSDASPDRLVIFVKLKTLLVPTVVFLLAGAFSAVSDQRSTAPEPKHLGFDMMVIGETVSKEHLRNWKIWKQAGVECNNCALTQVYPGDAQSSDSHLDRSKRSSSD